MTYKAIRGATSVEFDTEKEIDLAVKAMMEELYEKNGLQDDDIAFILFSQTEDLKSKNAARTMARSAETLPFGDLFRHASRLLADGGVLSVVVPDVVRRDFDCEAVFAGLYPMRACGVRTVPHKPVGRWLLAYGKQPVMRVDESVECLNTADMKRSEWYAGLTEDFYL